MANFGLVVEFTIDMAQEERFLSLISENARKSVQNEKGCQQFDVLSSTEQRGQIILYEIYDDEDAFKEHLKMQHVADFFAAAKPLILTQVVRRFRRDRGNLKGT